MRICINLSKSFYVKQIKFPRPKISCSRAPTLFCVRYLSKYFKMPRDQNSVATLKETRIRNKLSKGSRFPPGEMYLCVLGNGSISSPRALYMFTDHERYLFNCGEGTQRLAQEHKTKLSKLDHVFITHNSWENTGGLLGLSLTLQDMGVPQMTLHGPPDLDLLYEHSRAFVMLKTLEIRTKHFTTEKFSDDCMDVHYIPISADEESRSNSSSSDSTDYDFLEPGNKKAKQNIKRNVNMTIAYACRGHSKPGHLLFEKCVELRVPSGPLLGDLKNGKDVTLPCGKVIRSKDVVSEEQCCPVFLVVECPSRRFLNPFVTEKMFEQYQQNSADPSQVASLVVHFTPADVFYTPEYKKWIDEFPKSTLHLVLSDFCASLNSVAVHRIQHKLNLLNPSIFGLLREMLAPQTSEGNKGNIYRAFTLDRYYLRPANGYDRSTSIKFNSQEFIKEAMAANGFEQSLKDLNETIHKNSSSHINESQYPIITFLGTGSSIPSKARNVSAILLHISADKSILLDCGEGTHSQILRLYERYSDKVLQGLICIFISHMHADHHLGLVKMLEAREAMRKRRKITLKRLKIIGPRHLSFWLKQYHKSIKRIRHLYRFFECSLLEHDDLSEMQNCIFRTSPDIQLSTVPVEHCPDAHGVIIYEKGTEWKIVYSGDTMPCERLIVAGRNCSTLIHEATMEDELAEEAVLKRHSTTSEAIKVGEAMNSKYTILTHFSQRYAKIPLFNENFHNHVGCAFDNMTVRANEMYILPLLIPALKCLFAEEVEDMNTKVDKRRKKIELTNAMLASTSTQM